MARPLVVNDFLDNVNMTGSWSELQKGSLRKTFRRVNGKTLQANQSITSSSVVADVAGLDFNVQKGQKYRIEGTILTLTSASGLGLFLTVSGQTSPTVVLTGTGYVAAASATQRALTGTSIYDAATASVFKVDVNGFYVPDGDGVAKLQADLNTGSTASTVYAGSWLKLIRVG